MINSQPIAIVVRIPNVTCTRFELEAALGCRVARFEPTVTSSYAQLDIYEASDQWSEAAECIRAVSGIVEKLVSEGLIGRPSLDVALRFPSRFASTSASIPAGLAGAAGRAGMDINISIYLTEDAKPH
jgi:hypothetical protein